MPLSSRPLGPLLLLAGLLISTAEQAVAQGQAPKAGQAKPPVAADSSKVYNFVERMPVYPNGDRQALTAEFLREFRAASAVAGCSPPSKVFVSFTVGPSGTIYDVKSLNNQSTPNNLPKLSTACEAALAAAGTKLLRFTPGMQNRRRVAVTLTVKLGEGTP